MYDIDYKSSFKLERKKSLIIDAYLQLQMMNDPIFLVKSITSQLHHLLLIII